MADREEEGGMSARPSSLQAVLERQAAAVTPPAPPPAPTPAPPPAEAVEGRAGEGAQPSKPERFYRPSRDGRRFLGGHFDPKVVRQMKMLAAEEDTTTQALLEEALDLLFVKKGKGRIIGS
jgi:hypothetical protein